MRLRRLLLAFTSAASLLAGGAAYGQEDEGRALTPVASNRAAGTRVSVDIDKRDPQIGDFVGVCFSASAPGFVTLWDIDAAGAVSRIFPNALTPISAAAAQVVGGEKICAGRSGDVFRFRVDGPAGMDTLYAVWTASVDLQPKPGSYPNGGAFAADLARLNAEKSDQWATAQTVFDIRDPAAPPPPPFAGQESSFTPDPSDPPAAVPSAPPAPSEANAPQRPATLSGPQQLQHQQPIPRPLPQQSAPSYDRPKVVVLAMGSNVAPLTKTNQDAEVFTNAMARMFNIPPENRRLIRNAHKSEFKSGMDWLASRVRPQDMAVIYYSGHGAQAPDPTRTSTDGMDEAFVPYDFQDKAKPGSRDLVWSQEYARWVNALPTNNVLTVADACHSAGLTRSLSLLAPSEELLGARSKSMMLPADMDMTPPEDLAQPASRAIGGRNRVQAKGVLLAAARRDQSALEVSRGGLFTVSLLEEMGRARNMTLTQVAQATAARVNASTKGRQTPQVIAGNNLGERVTLGR